MKYSIYSITNPINDKVIYIGQTMNMPQRIKSHLAKSFFHNHILEGMFHDITLTGLEPIFTVLEVVDQEQPPIALELKWIQKMLDEGQPLCNKESKWYQSKLGELKINPHVIYIEDKVFETIKTLALLSGNCRYNEYIEHLVNQHALILDLKSLYDNRRPVMTIEEINKLTNY